MMSHVNPDPALPGVSTPSGELSAALTTALKRKGDAYKPRTHHVHDDGRPKFTNRLIYETSPYLLQHAHNPVNWYAWNDEAFERARREDRPILLSVGYSTCHWCHVMERESFEDEEIAGFINQNFVAIKVDREERPDVDDIYMKAVQMMTGRGGWPMTVVMTPDKQPFFGGTYFPPRDGDRGSRIGFLTILAQLRDAYAEKREQVVSQAERVSQRIRSAAAPERPGAIPGNDAIDRTVRQLASSYDPTFGGFGQAPKFPTPVNLDLMLRHFRRTGEARSREMVFHTLRKMASGGIYDHLAGGFHRYATDARWLVPHFEKMLYDNAQLVATYLEAYQISGEQEFARVAQETLNYVMREMTAEVGAFFSATDADSLVPETGHQEEGWFFTWTPEELREILGPERAARFGRRYGVAAGGNFEGRSILHTKEPLSEWAKGENLSVSEAAEELEASRRLLYRAREQRPPPFKDDKILTSWNGLMISAFARGGHVLDRAEYVAAAERAASFFLENMRTADGRLQRSYKDGKARHPAYLDDYAFLVAGLLDLYEASGRAPWLQAALALQGTLSEHYADEEHGGFFMTSDDHEKLLAREKPSYDGAEPSGTSVALLNLLRLHEFTGRTAYRKEAERGFAAFGRDLAVAGTGHTKLLSALDYYLDTPLEIAVIGTPEDREGLVAAVRSTFVPNRVLVTASEGKELSAKQAQIPWLSGKGMIQGKPTAFVCKAGVCALPTDSPEVLRKQLNEMSR